MVTFKDDCREYFVRVCGSDTFGQSAVDCWSYYTNKETVQKKVDILNEAFKSADVNMRAHVGTL